MSLILGPRQVESLEDQISTFDRSRYKPKYGRISRIFGRFEDMLRIARVFRETDGDLAEVSRAPAHIGRRASAAWDKENSAGRFTIGTRRRRLG